MVDSCVTLRMYDILKYFANATNSNEHQNNSFKRLKNTKGVIVTPRSEKIPERVRERERAKLRWIMSNKLCQARASCNCF